MRWTLPAFFFFFVAYILLFPVGLKPEIGHKPAWVTDVMSDSTQSAREHAGGVIPFVFDTRFGYVSDDGDLLLSKPTLFGVAIDSDRFINYSSVSGNLVVQDHYGEVTDNLAIRGYPILLQNRFFVISSNRAEMAELDDEGSIVWKREFASIISDFDAQSDLMALGLLDSRVQIVGSGGEVRQEIEFLGSRINAVYGCALSADGKILAVVHGLDPQYLSAYDLREGGETIRKWTLDAEFRTTRHIVFAGDGRYLLAEDHKRLLLFDLERKERLAIATSDTFLGTGEVSGHGLIWILSKREAVAELLLLQLPDRVIYRVQFPAEKPTLSVDESALLLGFDRYISKIEKVER